MGMTEKANNHIKRWQILSIGQLLSLGVQCGSDLVGRWSGI